MNATQPDQVVTVIHNNKILPISTYGADQDKVPFYRAGHVCALFVFVVIILIMMRGWFLVVVINL